MASTFKTPGVYVEEITKFPPSVAQVETAIPAFIGYTEKAIRNGVTQYFKPVAVRSLIEFESIYGGAPPEAVTVSLDDNNQVAKVAPEANFYLYDSLRMFYDNGGSKCYIVPVGPYRDNAGQITTKSLNHFKDGLAVLEKEDEPTIILAPDATLLANNGLYDFQAAALAQCGKLMDRVAILDLKDSDETISGDFDAKAQEFRDKVGIENLKYGAAYTPWLMTSLIKQTRYRYLSLIRQNGGATIGLDALTTDTAIKSFILDKLQKSISQSDEIQSKINTLTGGISLKTKFVDCQDAVESITWTTYTAYETSLNTLYSYLRDIMIAFSGATYRTSLSDIDGFKFKTGLEKIIKDNQWDEVLQSLVYYSNGFKIASSVTFNILLPGNSVLSGLKTELSAITGSTTINITSTAVSQPITALYTAAGTNGEKVIQVAINGAKAAFGILEASMSQLTSFAKQFEISFDLTLPEIFGTYKNILEEVNAHLTKLPPSSSIAGVYSSVDAEKGVWKAPANVSLRSVRTVTRRIDSFEQENLNVDVNAGKSINAIRAFSGKGILVWGARTLAGNDNEWRYISVRRFYNMVEESVRKSTERFVFEPNDAGTWVRVRAMIENFLTLQWRAGALAGAKPEDAFYVRVGLNQTMTALDILEGRMIVEIGMAVVRPAEFIILRFSHKMQES